MYFLWSYRLWMVYHLLLAFKACCGCAHQVRAHCLLSRDIFCHFSHLDCWVRASSPPAGILYSKHKASANFPLCHVLFLGSVQKSMQWGEGWEPAVWLGMGTSLGYTTLVPWPTATHSFLFYTTLTLAHLSCREMCGVRWWDTTSWPGVVGVRCEQDMDTTPVVPATHSYSPHIPLWYAMDNTGCIHNVTSGYHTQYMRHQPSQHPPATQSLLLITLLPQKLLCFSNKLFYLRNTLVLPWQFTSSYNSL